MNKLVNPLRRGVWVVALICLGTVPLFAQSLLLRTPPPGSSAPPSKPFNRAPGPPQTHRFWAAKNWFATDRTQNGGTYTLFPEPLALRTTAAGLLVGYSPQLIVQPGFFLHPVQPDFTIGTHGLHAERVTVTDSSDWTVDFDFGTLVTRVGRGMPFVYVTTRGDDPVLTFVSPPRIFSRTANTLGVALGENHYGLFCPSGGEWTTEASTFTCRLPSGKHSFSVALLPNPGALAMFARFAFVFPQTTSVSWSFDPRSCRVATAYSVSTRAMEGGETRFLQALYPHQYASLASGAAAGATDTGLTYASARGPMKLYSGDTFHTVDIFHGVLPFLPPPTDSPTVKTLSGLLQTSVPLATQIPVTDTYAYGKSLARAAQLLPLAALTHNESLRETVQTALEAAFRRWLEPGVASQPRTQGFVYNRDWSTLIGYPAAFGSDTQLNDHHFHYGYWIQAAALLGLYDSTWFKRTDGGRAVGSLVRDIATIDRNDAQFPFLRHFDVYAGHSWASGQPGFGDGENEESSSEAVNAWAGIILYATETGDTRLRDAAIWMYTLETNAAFDYWFDRGPVRTFPPAFHAVQVANLFDGKADSATWFGATPAFAHGIEFLPFTGASLYLGRDPAYTRANLAEVTRDSRGRIDIHAKTWPDLMEMYEAFHDPGAAMRDWQATSFTFDGETRAHEFAWIAALGELGQVDDSVTADTVFYAVFRTPSGRNHMAFNLENASRRVLFSDGFTVTIPPHAYSIEQRSVPIGAR